MTNYMTANEAAEKWCLTVRRVQVLCKNNRIPGVLLKNRKLYIPSDAKKPLDARIRSGKFRKTKK